MAETTWTEVVRVLAALGDAGCRVWVAGGWGVDLLVGRRTRSHRDLDLAIDAAGLAAGMAALESLGYAVQTDWLPVRVELALAGRGWVDLHPVVFDEAGAGVQAGFDGEVFDYPASDLVVGRLAQVPCVSAAFQRRVHTGYELREVDRHDLALLDALDQP